MTGEASDNEAGDNEGYWDEPADAEVPAQRAPAVAPSPARRTGVLDAGADLAPQLEAVLMVVEHPVEAEALAQVLERDVAEVDDVLLRLSAEYTAEGRGFDLRHVAGGWRFYSRPEQAAAVERFVLDGQQARLTQAALETLAVVAYRQPVSRSRVSVVRGVNCDAVMRTLVTRELVEECGVESESGALLYRTTPYFLERMGLTSLDELPDLAPFLPEVEALEAESEDGAEALTARPPRGAALPAPSPAGDAFERTVDDAVAPEEAQGGDTGGVHPVPDDETTTDI